MVLYIPLNRSELARWTLEFPLLCRRPPRPGGLIYGEASRDIWPLPEGLYSRRPGPIIGTSGRRGSGPQRGHGRPPTPPSARAGPRCRSLDHLICPRQERLRDRQAERLSGLEVDDQLELRRLLDEEIPRLSTCLGAGRLRNL